MVFVLSPHSSMKLTVRKFAEKAALFPKTRLKHFGNQVGGKHSVGLLPDNWERLFFNLLLPCMVLPFAFEPTTRATKYLKFRPVNAIVLRPNSIRAYDAAKLKTPSLGAVRSSLTFPFVHRIHLLDRDKRNEGDPTDCPPSPGRRIQLLTTAPAAHMTYH